MDTVTIAHAKEHLEELIERAARGEEVRIEVLTGGTVQVLRLSASPVVPRKALTLGQWRGIVHIPEDKLFEPLTEDELDWVSGELSP